MTDLPPLPDSNDPYELLGVERGCDEAELKQAYARLVRIYRPDRAPAEFQRVQAAFDAAREGLAYFDDYEDEFDDDDYDEDISVQESAPGEHYATAERIEHALLHGPVDEAVEAVQDLGYMRAADADPFLRALAMRVACVAAWTAPTEAATIRKSYTSEEFHDWWDQVYDERRTLLPEWERWRRKHRKPEWLPRLMELADSVYEDDLAKIVPHDPRMAKPLLAALDRMDKFEERLLHVLVRGADDDPDGDAEPDERQVEEIDRMRRKIGFRLGDRKVLSALIWLILIGATSGIAIIFLLAALRGGPDEDIYKRIVRPKLFRLADRGHVSPILFARWVQANRERAGVNRYTELIEQDLPLRCMWLVLRLSRLNA